jgi:ubiquitin-conjugating enzyme E2 Z
MRDPLPGICVWCAETDLTTVYALVTGTADSPYEGGTFLFLMRAPHDYPSSPPRVKLLTTGSGRVRFNPNLYRNGKVCLSILGTWAGPGWSPAQSISSVLLSIQTLMCENPYHNEPGFERGAGTNANDVRDYSRCIQHETIRVAALGSVEDNAYSRSMPPPLRATAAMNFAAMAPFLAQCCRAELHRDGQDMRDPFTPGRPRGQFQFGAMLKRIDAIVAATGSGGEAAEQGAAESAAAPAAGGGGGERAPPPTPPAAAAGSP